MKEWLNVGEALKEKLCKQTQLVKFSHKQRLEVIASESSNQLRDIQEAAARRHGRLMQKVNQSINYYSLYFYSCQTSVHCFPSLNILQK